jgi:hypothetical protein
MTNQFIPLTLHEHFFGINRAHNYTSNFVSNAVVPPTQFEGVAKPSAPIIPSVVSNVSNTVTAPDTGKILIGDFIWKYRWEISLIAIAIAGTVLYVYSQKKNDEEPKTQSNYKWV